MIDALANRLAAFHVNHRKIVAGAALIGLLTIIAKLFVAAREMVIAWRLGISTTVDSYQLALTITTWLPMMVTSVMTAVLVPRLVALRGRENGDRSFIAELNGTILLVGVAISGLTLIAAPAVSSILASAANQEALGLTSAMSQRMAPLGLLTIAIGYLSARLQSQERFAYSVTEAVPAIAIALCVIAPFAGIASARLVWGTLLGYALQTLLLCAMIWTSGTALGSLRIRHRSNEWRSVYGAAFVMAAAQVTLALSIPVDQAFASRLGPGAVATLGYANRVVVLVTGLGAVVLARAILPVFAAAAGAGELKLGARQARQWAWLLTGCGAFAAAMIWIFADWGVAAIFERGAFTSRNSAAVAETLRFGALQLPFYFGGLAIVQWIVALGRYSTLLIIACVALATKLAINLLLVPLLGLDGIMIATAAMYAVSFLCQFVVARPR